jgi:hypothetical protein
MRLHPAWTACLNIWRHAGWTAQEVHLLVIAALILGTATIYFAWRTQVPLSAAPPPFPFPPPLPFSP